jgi:hypothetical protein
VVKTGKTPVLDGKFHSSSGVGHISIPWRRRSLMVCAKPNVDN